MSDKQMTLFELHETYHRLQDGEIILDVRNPDEYRAGHVPNSLNIPLPELPARTEELRKYKTIFIHCKRGGRAKSAFDTLVSKGFGNVVCVYDAGMDLWIEKGFPVNRI